MKKIVLRCAKYYWTYIASLFFRHKRPKNVQKRVLITRFDGLGDFFLLVPFLQQLIKQEFEIVVISPAINKEIIDHLEIPLTFVPFNNSSMSEFGKLLKFVRKTSFSHAFNLSMNIWGGFLVNQSKAVVKIGLLQEKEGYVYKGAKLFYDNIRSYPCKTHSFDVLRNMFAEYTGIENFSPRILSPVFNSEWIVLHPYATWKPRQWPWFSLLIEYLVNNKYKVKVIGTEKEHLGFSLPAYLTYQETVKTISLSSVDQLMGEIDHCRAFIGNDSGPAHYAALIGKPTTVIWGPGFFERIHPKGKNVNFSILPIECRPCRQKGDTCKRGVNKCLQDNTLEMVIEKFKKSLDQQT